MPWRSRSARAIAVAVGSAAAGLEARNFASTSVSNPTGYADKDFDAGLDALRVAKTLPQQQAALEKLVARWNDTVPSISTETVTEAILAKPNVKGMQATNYTTMIFSNAYLAK